VTLPSASGAAVNYTTSFVTGAGADTTPPTVQQVIPNKGANGIPISAPVAVTFSKPMQPEVSLTAFTLKPFTSGCAGATGAAVAGSGAWTTPTRTLTFTPTANLAP